MHGTNPKIIRAIQKSKLQNKMNEVSATLFENFNT